jgi:hypothetical protein
MQQHLKRVVNSAVQGYAFFVIINGGEGWVAVVH